jgi:copper chaperone CopZ
VLKTICLKLNTFYQQKTTIPLLWHHFNRDKILPKFNKQMEIYHIKVRNLRLKEAIQNIIRELKKLYAVLMVDVNIEKSEIKIILGELGSIIACRSLLNNLGYTVIEIF